MRDVPPSVDTLHRTLQRQIRPRRTHAGVLRRRLTATHKSHCANMARKAEVRALTTAVEGTNTVALAAPAPIPPPPSPPCPPRRRIADTVVRAMRSSPPVFVLASPALPPSSPNLRPLVHVAGERFTTTAARPAVEAETTSMTAHFPKTDGV
uniref:Uncharacterized protein n=1 Tax=Leersia perrieri TaxID=77586 RepID=A0A0D9V242_9ORYZ